MSTDLPTITSAVPILAGSGRLSHSRNTMKKQKKRSRRARTSFILHIVAAVLYAVSATAWVWLAIHDSSWAWIPASLFSVASAGHVVLAHHMFTMIRVYRASEDLNERLAGIYR